MTFSVSELRSQLSKPTRRGSMKMVLEAAIEELKVSLHMKFDFSTTQFHIIYNEVRDPVSHAVDRRLSIQA